jgi:flagellar hook-associated protein 3 FlgL
MRTTDRGLFDAARVSIGAARERQAKAAARASTGVEVQHPWDSPSAGAIARERFLSSQAQGISRTTSRALDDATATDNALASVLDALGAASALAVQMANDSFQGSDRAAAANSAEQLLQQAIGALNVEVGGRFPLGGTKNDTAPFTSTGAYVGDTGERRLEVAPGQTQVVSVRADVVIGGSGGGVDVLGAMRDLKTALEANDTTAIRASIDTLRNGVAQVAGARAQVGGIQLGLQIASDSFAGLRDAADTRRAGMADADFVDAATDLSFAERALEAAMTASAKTFRLSLLDKL